MKTTKRSAVKKKGTKKEKLELDMGNDFYLLGVTRHPPEGEFTPEEFAQMPAYICETELPVETTLLLRMRESEFEKTKNPVYLIEAFLIAHRAHLYPPLWVLDSMATVFEKYHNSMGEIGLDVLFGFKKWKGQDPAFKPVLNEQRDEMLMHDIFRLNLLGYSIEDASFMVQRKLEETPRWNKSGFKLREPKAKTLEFRYKKSWSKILNDDFYTNSTLKWLKTHKEHFLSTFPKDSFSHKRKQVKKPRA